MRVSTFFPAVDAANLRPGFGDFDRVFQKYFGERPANAVEGQWNAPIAIWEEGDRTYVELEIAGVAKESLEISVQNGRLTITGERQTPDPARTYRHNERQYGKFEQVFRLPEEIDPESVAADLKDGVLTVSLSKRAEALPKKIEVRTS